MYVLEFRTANRHHTWLRCAICETKAPLERVRRGQMDMMRWRILRLPGTVQAACAKWRSVPLMRYGQKSAYKRYNADVFTGVNRRTAAVFQFHSAALRRLNKVGCQRYEGDYTRLKQKHAERRARRMAG